MTDLIIRSIKQEDFDDVMRIQEAILQRKVPPHGVNLVKLHLSKPDGISLVAERQGEVIGYLFGEVKHGDFGLEQSGWIEMFGVSPKAMGQGVGRTLAKGAMDWFREKGVRDIYTAVRWDSGDHLAFFKKIGFSLSNYINLKTRLD